MSQLLKISIFLILLISNSYAQNLKNCEWNNKEGIPCVVIGKTPNTSEYSEVGVNKVVITKEEINNLWKEEQYKEWREDIKKHPEKVGKLHITEDSFTFEFGDKNKKN